MQIHELREFLLRNVPMDTINDIQFWETMKVSKNLQADFLVKEVAAQDQKKAVKQFELRTKGKTLTWKDQLKLILIIAHKMYPSEDGYREERRGPIYEALLEHICSEIKPGDWKRALVR